MEQKQRNYKLAAPIGFAVIALALVGVVALSVWGAQIVNKLQDDSEQKAEILSAITLVVGMDPVPFNRLQEASDDFLLSATLWQTVNNQAAAGGYPSNDNGELIIPKSDAEVAFRQLFGPDHQVPVPSGGEVGQMRYSPEINSYLMPISAFVANAKPEIAEEEHVREYNNVYTVRVRYLSTESSLENMGGEQNTAYKTMIYRLGKSETGYYIIAVINDSQNSGSTAA